MRVIAGSAKGRRLKSAKGMVVRPTADRVKEALFSILTSRFDLRGAAVLDLFAGTGAVGIEALSRGAGRVVFVEQNRAARQVLAANVDACGFSERVQILAVSARHALRELAAQGVRFDGVFLDPPYRKGLVAETVEQLARAAILRPGAWVMVERHAEDAIEEQSGPMRLTQTRRYGKTALSLYCAAEGDDEGCAE